MRGLSGSLKKFALRKSDRKRQEQGQDVLCIVDH
jgi:hypothetical protein